MTDQPSATQPVQSEPKSGFIQWFVISLILMTALSLLAVHLPERLKLLLVYAVVYGLISGGTLTTLAVKFGLPTKKVLLLIIIGLTICGQTLVLYLSHQRYQEATLIRFQADQTAIVMERMFATNKPPDEPEAREGYEQMLKQFQAAKAERREKEQNLLKISSYLKHRISPVANLTTPWPELFWLLELVLCCLAAVWASRQVTQSEKKS